MKETFSSKIGERIQEIRNFRKTSGEKEFDFCKSQASFGEKLGLDWRTISNYENNRTEPDFERLIELCKWLKCDPNYLFGNQDIDRRTESVYEAAEKIGLSVKATERIYYDAFLLKFLNYCLESDESTKIIASIEQFAVAEKMSKKIPQALYTDMFRKKLESTFSKFYFATFPTERCKERYMIYIKQEIPYIKVKSTNDKPDAFDQYLRLSLSETEYQEFMLKSGGFENKTEIELYDMFFGDIVEFTYDLFLHSQNRSVMMIQIAQAVVELLSKFEY